MNWKENKAKLLNELGQVHMLNPHRELIDEAILDGAKIDYLYNTGWSGAFCMSSENGAYRVNPVWLDAKIAEKEETEPEYADFPVEVKDDGVPMCGIFSLAEIQTHSRFAGLTSEDGCVYAGWGEWVEAKKQWDSKESVFSYPDTEKRADEEGAEMSDCECKNWCREGGLLLTEHHPRCKRYAPEADARKVIERLITGIESWAEDCDGIHPDCWDAYQRACAFVGQFHKLEEVSK